MVEEGLEAREQEHESCIEVAFPQRSVFVSHETQEKTVVEDKQRINTELPVAFLFDHSALKGHDYTASNPHILLDFFPGKKQLIQIKAETARFLPCQHDFF